MVKFRFITNDLNSTSYDGPSGMRYIIYLNQAFIVENKDDIDFFRSKPNRFEEVGLFTPKPEPKKDVDVLLKQELDKIKGLKKNTKEKILIHYLEISKLKDDVEEGYSIHPSVDKKQLELLVKHFSPKPRFDTVDIIKKRIKKTLKKKR